MNNKSLQNVEAGHYTEQNEEEYQLQALVYNMPPPRRKMPENDVLSMSRLSKYKQTWRLTPTESIKLITDGEMGGGGRGYRDWGRGRLYTYRYTVTTRMTCIKMGSDESHFNVSLIVRDKVTRQCPQTTTSEEKGEPKRNRTAVPLLTSLTPYPWAKPAH